MYDPKDQRFKLLDSAVSPDVLPANAPLAIRFSEGMLAASLSPQTAALLGPLGRAPSRILPSRDGFLAFFAPAAGQSATLLPDGRWLLLGGEVGGRPLSTAAIANLCSGQTTPLPNSLLSARAWHSATLLPDGNVLVLGGVGPDGVLVRDAEIFNPTTQTFQALPDTGLLPRARHTATVLTDGRVLIAGGVSDHGEAVAAADLWNSNTGKAEPFAASLRTARFGHYATLTSDGSVLIWAGQAASGAVAASEAYDPRSQSFSTLDANDPAALLPLTDAAAAPAMASTLPDDGATGVPIDSLVAARFAKPLRMSAGALANMTLMGPTGQVAAGVAPAEDGLLAFLTHTMPLQPASRYTLFVNGVTDEAGIALPFSAVGFTTASLTPTAGDTGSGTVTGPMAAPATSANAAVRPLAAAALATDDEVWIPGADALRGDWRAKRLPSPLQNLLPLRASAVTTALSGQVLLLDGRAAANVTLSIGDKTVPSDSTGRFLITGLATGPQTLIIDGTSASTPGKTYGVFEDRISVPKAGQTNVLPYTIWMPRIATQYAVSIASPTTSEAVVTNPQIPGLELHIPKGTVIRDRSGRVVTEVSITPIPVDRPPSPCRSIMCHLSPCSRVAPICRGSTPPAPSAPEWFTRTTTASLRRRDWTSGATIRWTRAGTFTARELSRRTVNRSSPILAWPSTRFTGAMVSLPSNAPAEGPPPNPCRSQGQAADPVNCFTGLFLLERTDLTVNDTVPLTVARAYRPRDNTSRSFGIGTNLGYDFFMVGDIFPYTYQDLILPDGGRIHFARISSGTGFTDAVYTATTTPTRFYGARLEWASGGPGPWKMTLKDGTVVWFPDSTAASNPRAAAPLRITDRNGNSLNFTRDSNHNLTRVTSPNGRYVKLTYDTANRITQAQDNIGRTVGYAYDTSGRLVTVTDANSGVERYTYDTNNNLLTVKKPNGIVTATNTYDANNRVQRQTLADGGIYQFAYTLGPNGQVTQTEVTDPRGNVRRMSFTATGYVASEIKALGKAEQQTWTYQRDPSTNLLLSVTDPLARITAYTYDAMGNTTGATRLSGTPHAVSTSYTYEPTFNQLTSLTDPLGHATTFAYDASGNLVSLTNAFGDQSRFSYNGAGQVTATSDPLVHSTSFNYDGGDLTSITDPLGNTTNHFTDGIGRTLSVADPLGNLTLFDHDSLSRVTQITDPLGAQTHFGYDADGNRTSVIDARSGTTTYTYDGKDRLVARVDPLNKTETYSYDKGDNLVSFTDRKGQLRIFTYDALNRRSFAGFGATKRGQDYIYLSTVSYTLDGGDRLTQTVDSQSGTISRGYDLLDRLTNEATAQGQVSYTYDDAGRRTGMTVGGQSAVTYAYDSADRLTGIVQGTAQVGIVWDAASRTTRLTLANGVVTTYTYDSANRLTGISYTEGTTTLGGLTYSYDAAGRRTALGDSFGRTGLPAALSAAAYDAANRLTHWGSTNLSYDANGNLLGDGTYGYNWDERNRLSAISNGQSTVASFAYDPFGRRTAKTVAGVTTGFLYDGLNTIQERSGTTPTANLMAGLGIDEVFLRTDSAGARSFLKDALGSTVALTDDSGAVRTNYTYEPYGKTTQGGDSSTNRYQFTGRENDGTGLFYYRARYYHPGMQRFVAEDPIGFAGGINTYAYVAGNPTNYLDPYGLYCLLPEQISSISGAIGGGVGGAITGAIVGGELGPGMAIAGAIGGGVAGAGAGLGAGAASHAVGGAASGAVAGAPGGFLGMATGALGGEAASALGGGAVGGAVGGALGGIGGTWCWLSWRNYRWLGWRPGRRYPRFK